MLQYFRAVKRNKQKSFYTHKTNTTNTESEADVHVNAMFLKEIICSNDTNHSSPVPDMSVIT